MTLNETEFNKKYIIKSVNILGIERNKMYDLGIMPGNTIVKKYNSIFNDPSCYEINNFRFAIRNKDAKMIRVEINE